MAVHFLPCRMDSGVAARAGCRPFAAIRGCPSAPRSSSSECGSASQRSHATSSKCEKIAEERERERDGLSLLSRLYLASLSEVSKMKTSTWGAAVAVFVAPLVLASWDAAVGQRGGCDATAFNTRRCTLRNISIILLGRHRTSEMPQAQLWKA